MKVLLFVLAAAALHAQDVSAPQWSPEESRRILEKTRTIRLAPSLDDLGPGERVALAKLLEAGAIFQRLYEDQKHAESLAAHARLEKRHRANPTAETQRLLDLYRLFEGPIATTLDNRRVPFLDVASVQPGKNVYPPGATNEEIESFLAERPELRETILAPRTIVRRATAANLERDLGVLARHADLAVLHPGLRSRLVSLSENPDAEALYAVPYSVAWADELHAASLLLWEAAGAIEKEDEDFAQYLRNRSRDLLSDDYESGDAAWVTGRFDDLNAQIGSYETYDDELFGTKTFFSTSLLLRDREASEQLRRAIAGLQEFENSLPYAHHKKVREDIPVGVYDVIADFGQARGTNTATILPNESDHARKYGRTILLRSNIMRHPELFASSLAAWRAAVEAPFEDDLTSDGNFHRTLWHEIGHYLGPARDARGRDLDLALEASADALEEMKADLVSLFLAPELRRRGYYDDAQLRSVYASGIRRVLQNNRPRRDQPYQTMQLMQWNWFLEKGLVRFDPASRQLAIDYDRYHEVVASLLERVLAIQYAGDADAAAAFIDQYTAWDETLHGAVARAIRDAQTHRFTLVRYAALGE